MDLLQKLDLVTYSKNIGQMLDKNHVLLLALMDELIDFMLFYIDLAIRYFGDKPMKLLGPFLILHGCMFVSHRS